MCSSRAVAFSADRDLSTAYNQLCVLSPSTQLPDSPVAKALAQRFVSRTRVYLSAVPEAGTLGTLLQSFASFAASVAHPESIKLGRECLHLVTQGQQLLQGHGKDLVLSL